MTYQSLSCGCDSLAGILCNVHALPRHLQTIEAVSVEHIVLTRQEAAELYRFTKNDYISPNNYPALTKLVVRVGQYLDARPCDECDGRGKYLDAPGNVLDGGCYMERCHVCGGSGKAKDKVPA